MALPVDFKNPLPPARGEGGLNHTGVDWREHPFERGSLIDGEWVSQGDAAKFKFNTKGGEFKRQMAVFRNKITPAGEGGEFEAMPGRYHLFVSGVCPWASKTRTMLSMLGLDVSCHCIVRDRPDPPLR